MNYKIFNICIPNSENETERMNKFLSGVRIISVQKEIVITGGSSYWSFVIEYFRESDTNSAGRKNKIDYREVLSEEDFAVYSTLRGLRKQIAESENIRIAYYKAKKGKRFKKAVLIYNQNLEKNLQNLQVELKNRNVPVGNYHFFKIFDPKKRIICAADFRERILHHAIMNVLDSVFERFQIFDSFACRKNKGTHTAVKRAFYFTKKYSCFVKMDVRKYFDSIAHGILKKLLQKKIKDKAVLNLLDPIIDSYSKTPRCGIPIGNLTSQYFANFYLGFADRYIKETLKIHGYVRYMDDMVIWGNNQQKLNTCKNSITSYIKNMLELDIKPSYSNRFKSGVPFLGYLLKPHGIYLQQRNKKRFVMHYLEYLYKYNNNVWDETIVAEHTQAIIAWTLIAKARKFRYTLFKRYSPRTRTA